jgi:hypothetical protein
VLRLDINHQGASVHQQMMGFLQVPHLS